MLLNKDVLWTYSTAQNEINFYECTANIRFLWKYEKSDMKSDEVISLKDWKV